MSIWQLWLSHLFLLAPLHDIRFSDGWILKWNIWISTTLCKLRIFCFLTWRKKEALWQHCTSGASQFRRICKICTRKVPVKRKNTSNLRSRRAQLPQNRTAAKQTDQAGAICKKTKNKKITLNGDAAEAPPKKLLDGPGVYHLFLTAQL